MSTLSTGSTGGTFRCGSIIIESNVTGSGSFGQVMKGIGELDGLEYAVKSIDMKMNEEFKKQCISEIRTMAKLRHENLVSYHTSFQDESQNKLYIMMEYCQGGNLEDKITSGKILIEEMPIIALQIASGLEYMHSQHAIHLDIKPRNIVFKNNIAKICDFGLSKFIQNSKITANLYGTRGYIAPEVTKGELSFKADVYSYGVLLYKMIYKEMYTPELFGKKLNEEGYDQLKAIIKECVAQDPIKRSDMPRIVSQLKLINEEATTQPCPISQPSKKEDTKKGAKVEKESKIGYGTIK